MINKYNMNISDLIYYIMILIILYIVFKCICYKLCYNNNLINNNDVNKLCLYITNENITYYTIGFITL